jgi:TRAP-type C4-dicarboxylate transport system permease small subunit
MIAAIPALGRLARALDRVLARSVDVAMWLALPLALLLFLQWPLREWIQAGSREANDGAQCLFALFIAVAVTAATRDGAHLASDAFAHRLAPAMRRRILHGALLLGVLPWAVYLAATAGPQAWTSLRQLEGFPETYNPGYFIIRVAVVLLAVLVTAQALLALAGVTPDDGTSATPPRP